jgi:two-component system NtrC family response regulator
VKGFTPSAILAIEKHPWLGNVREIENRIKRAVIMAEGQKIEPEDMELSSSAEGHESKGLREAREDLERKFIKMALDDNDGNISKAVEQLGISRPTFYKLMEKFGMEEKKK